MKILTEEINEFYLTNNNVSSEAQVTISYGDCEESNKAARKRVNLQSIEEGAWVEGLSNLETINIRDCILYKDTNDRCNSSDYTIDYLNKRILMHYLDNKRKGNVVFTGDLTRLDISIETGNNSILNIYDYNNVSRLIFFGKNDCVINLNSGVYYNHRYQVGHNSIVIGVNEDNKEFTLYPVPNKEFYINEESNICYIK